MEQKKCTNCGRLYPEDAAYCPGCNHPNEVVVAEIAQHEEQKREAKVTAAKGIISGWNTFANVLMWVGAAAVVIAIIVCFATRWKTPSIFFVTLVAYISDLWFCGMLKLLAKIELNTRK